MPCPKYSNYLALAIYFETSILPMQNLSLPSELVALKYRPFFNAIIFIISSRFSATLWYKSRDPRMSFKQVVDYPAV